jgi:hypothetical protein
VYKGFGVFRSRSINFIANNGGTEVAGKRNAVALPIWQSFFLRRMSHRVAYLVMLGKRLCVLNPSHFLVFIADGCVAIYASR